MYERWPKLEVLKWEGVAEALIIHGNALSKGAIPLLSSHLLLPLFLLGDGDDVMMIEGVSAANPAFYSQVTYFGVTDQSFGQ